MPDGTEPHAPAGHGGVYGITSIGGVDVGFPLTALREAVPRPATIAPLPGGAPWVIGVMDLRQAPMPVVDLSSQVGGQAPDGGGGVVLVIGDGVRRVGLVVDGVRGLARVVEEALAPVATGEGSLFTHCFRDAVRGGVTSVLDVAAILDLSGLPSVSDAAVTAGRPATGASTSYVVARAGDYTLAIEALAVHTTVPLVAPEPSVIDGPLCIGVMSYMGRRVAVVDPLRVAGLEPPGKPGGGPGIVLDLGCGYVVLALSELIAIIDVDDDRVAPVPSFAFPRPDLVLGVTDATGAAQCVVLDGRALRAEPELLALAAVNTAAVLDGADPASLSGDHSDPAGGHLGAAHITYTAGVRLATPLEQVEEVLPYPRELLDTNGADHLLGVIVHRGRSVPVVALAALLGRTPGEVSLAACVLVVEAAGSTVGFAVDGLGLIAPLSWHDPADAPSAPAAHQRRDALRASPLVRIGADSHLFPQLDLRAMAAELLGAGAELLGPGLAAGAELAAGESCAVEAA